MSYAFNEARRRSRFAGDASLIVSHTQNKKQRGFFAAPRASRPEHPHPPDAGCRSSEAEYVALRSAMSARLARKSTAIRIDESIEVVQAANLWRRGA